MSSIYQQALGRSFRDLHPQIQRRFGFSSKDNVAAIGTGTMDEVWHGLPCTLPFLYIGTWRSIMFPERGRDVPFTIENYAYVDPYGRETVTWNRTFQTRRWGGRPRPRRFDATMVYSRERGRIVDYLGTHQHLAVDIDVEVDDETGGIRLRSGEQRFHERKASFRFPMLFSGYADVREWYDDEAGRFRIKVEVRNRTWGKLFGYHGAFDCAWRPTAPDQIPPDQKPKRHERRE